MIPSDDIREIGQALDSPEVFSGKTVLLTGAAGFLGRYFVEVFDYLNAHVLTRPVTVLAMDNFIASSGDDLGQFQSPHIKFFKHDVVEPYNVSQKLDYIIHAAGIASPYYYRKFPLETLDVAVHGTRKMLELAREHRAKFLFFSSSEIYGDPHPDFVPTPEHYRGNISSLGPRACYDESKRLGETLCFIFSQEFGTDVNIVRPFNVYGPGMRENDYRVLPNFASRLVAKKPLSIYSSGLQTRTFCYITDAMNGFLRVLQTGRPGEVYNIGNPRPEVSVAELVQAIQGVLRTPVPVEYVTYPDTYPSDEPQRRCPDITKAQTHVGYTPQISLEQGLDRFFRWALANYKGLS